MTKEKLKFNPETFLKILKTYQKEKISLDEFNPHLYELKSYLQSTYDITVHSEDIFENLAMTILEIWGKKYTIHEPSNSLDSEIMESVLALSEITPMNANVSESLHVILNLES